MPSVPDVSLLAAPATDSKPSAAESPDPSCLLFIWSFLPPNQLRVLARRPSRPPNAPASSSLLLPDTG